MRRIEARRKNAKAFRLMHSQSLAKRRQRLSQAMVRSTIHRLGKTAKPFAISERLTISTSICRRIFANGGLKDRWLGLSQSHAQTLLQSNHYIGVCAGGISGRRRRNAWTDRRSISTSRRVLECDLGPER